MSATAFDTINLSSSFAVTAAAGGGQANATQLTSGINRIATVATIADSVKLPTATAQGLNQVPSMVVVINDTANSAQVFGQAGETINGAATGTGVALAAGKTATFYTAGGGKYFMNLSA